MKPGVLMRFAYADPPYIGQAKRHYGHEVTYAGEVDHHDLLCRLARDYDAWALSCSSVSLQEILYWCEQIKMQPRIAAWVKPFASFKPNVNPAYAWEPVLFAGERDKSRSEDTVRDWVRANITLKRGVHGAKPEAFAFWLFSLMGLRAGDEFIDLYPGSGAMTRAWGRYLNQLVPVLL